MRVHLLKWDLRVTSGIDFFDNIFVIFVLFYKKFGKQMRIIFLAITIPLNNIKGAREARTISCFIYEFV